MDSRRKRKGGTAALEEWDALLWLLPPVPFPLASHTPTATLRPPPKPASRVRCRLCTEMQPIPGHSSRNQAPPSGPFPLGVWCMPYYFTVRNSSRTSALRSLGLAVTGNLAKQTPWLVSCVTLQLAAGHHAWRLSSAHSSKKTSHFLLWRDKCSGSFFPIAYILFIIGWL